MIKIFHNNRCGKSRCAFDLLSAEKAPFETVEYLKNPPSEAEIRDLLRLLDKKPLDIIRQKEPVFQENFKGKNFSDDEWIALIAAHPILLERPIVVVDGKAWVARDEAALAAIRQKLEAI
ncbi:MAG TPA: ArsC/Spx/MgsR family protein [Saprospiraceae bacterium]|nr:ArsC/Spx/MgsR family protein [Saprospiraceae bacterium]HNM25483.1 ArsC/Spx/MgsR family protein [Saprospiraceae bacterium]